MQSLATKLFNEGIKKRDAELVLNKLRIVGEKLQKRNVELSSSNTDLIKRSTFSPTEYLKIEKEHLNVVDKLQSQSVELISKKEDAESKYIELAKINNSLSSSIEKLKTQNEKLPIVNRELKSEVKNTIGELNQQKVLFSKLKKESSQTIVKYQKEIKLNKSVLNDLKREIKTERKQIHEDNRLLAIRQNDLRILEVRLKKRYPNIKIIL